MDKIEQRINTLLQKYPRVKIVVKRAYQLIMVTILPKEKKKGNIKRVTPKDEWEYFFGYYDKSPWDNSGRYMLCLRARNTIDKPDNTDTAEIVLIDTKSNNCVNKIGQTTAWNVQQGCMLQWIGPDYEKRIIYNDYRNGRYCSVIFNLESKDEVEIGFPIYSLSRDGEFALSLDFSRLHSLRPGYGYANIPEKTIAERCPNSCCVWKVDLKTNTVKSLLTYSDFASFEPKESMKKAVHKVNHLMISPDCTRFMVLHRWFDGGHKYSRLVTCDVDGENMYNLLDDGFVSHYSWINSDEIIAFANVKGEGKGYYLLKDKTNEKKHIWKDMFADGHPSISVNNEIVTDTYPNRKRMSKIFVLSLNGDRRIIAEVFSPFKYDNDTRCDLHPRWNHDGTEICFDGVFEGKRALYTVENIKGKRKRVLICLRKCVGKGPVYQTFNILKHMDSSLFCPFFLTLKQEEKENTVIDLFNRLPIDIHFVNGTNLAIFLGTLFRRGRIIDEICKLKPDVIHTTGIVVDLLGYQAAKRIGINQVSTIRNYVYDDYIKKFGKNKGMIIAKVHLFMMKHMNKRCKYICCSKSLAEKYKEEQGISMDYIRNGVDTDRFNPDRLPDKKKCRDLLGLDSDTFYFITVAQVIERKNIDETIDAFLYANFDKKVKFILVGTGDNLERLIDKYSNQDDLIFKGEQSNVEYWLKASDAFVSSSESEGLPNSVIEAMAMRLPVVLSDIPQHKELFNLNKGIGVMYPLNDVSALRTSLRDICNCNCAKMGDEGRALVTSELSSIRMSAEYQELYRSM